MVQPQPSSFTDEQFRAAGWSNEKIEEFRRQENSDHAEALAAQQAALQQNAYGTQIQQQPVHSQQAIQTTQQQNLGQDCAPHLGQNGAL